VSSTNREVKISVVIGDFLKKLRKNFNYTQFDVAVKSELSMRHYQSIEHGSVTCKVDTLEKILSIYNYTFLSFLDECMNKEFQNKGITAMSSMLSPDTFRYLTTDSKGRVTEYAKDAGHWSGYTYDDVMNSNFYIWDFVESDIEKSFLKTIFTVVGKLQPTPIAWTGSLKQKNGKHLRVKVYWKYRHQNLIFDGIELIAIRIL
jgi:transcriptional regulator with XRE-family HTH domain